MFYWNQKIYLILFMHFYPLYVYCINMHALSLYTLCYAVAVNVLNECMLCFIIFKVQEEFVKNMENTSVESLIQKLAESKGTGKERPGNTAKSLTHGINLWH